MTFVERDGTVAAYAALSSDTPLVPVDIHRRQLRTDDVAIEIAYTGICHTDIHIARNDWKTSLYPVVPGHEIAGVVSAVGNAVTRFKPGDRVGVGCFVDSCGVCRACMDSSEQHCVEGAVLTYNSETDEGVTAGGYATSIVVGERFVLSIPDRIPLESAAPLMCAGTTMFAPLRRFAAGPGKRVGIVGLGGLGHLGVMLARAMGADVTVLSRTQRKRKDAVRFGANRYLSTDDAESVQNASATIDLLLNTVSSKIDLDRYFSLLARNGVLVELGIPDAPLELEGFSLIILDRMLAGSFVGSPRDTEEMLEFCAEHDIRPEVEIIAPDQLNAAFDRVVRGDVKYRFVVDIGALRGQVESSSAAEESVSLQPTHPLIEI